MKKVYSKPEIQFEDFTMSTSIAAGCEKIVGNPSQGTCGIIGSGGYTIFNSSVGGGCVFTPEDTGNGAEDVYDGACYHVPNDYSNFFNS